MRKSRFTQEEIVNILREREAGAKMTDICDRYGISRPTFYGWRAKFGGLSISSAQRLKELEGENGDLRRLLAKALLDNAVMKSRYQKATPSGG